MSSAGKSSDDTPKTQHNKPGPAAGEGGAPVKPEAERKKVNTGFRTTVAVRKRIDQAAEEKGVSRGEIIRRAIRSYLDL